MVTGKYFDNIVLILMENHSIGDIIPSATFMTQLANQNALLTHYTAIDHPSEGNYVVLVAGNDYGFTNDCGYCPGRSNALNIIDRLESGGLTWRGFAEDASNSGTPQFQPPRGTDHFAFPTFSDNLTTSRAANYISVNSSTDAELLSHLNSANPANYIWFTPIDSNNMHDNSVSSGDAYLSNLVPQILSSTLFTTKRAALVILFDEGNNNFPSDFVYFVAVGPVVKKAFSSANQYSHYSLLHLIEDNWSLPTLTSNDGSAPIMSEMFTSGSSGPSPLFTSFTVSSNPTVNVPVTFTSSTSGGVPPYTINWNFGDGISGSGTTISHVYNISQSYTIVETAFDSSGSTATHSQSITVAPTPPTGSGTFDNTWSTNNVDGDPSTVGSISITNGILSTRESTTGGNDNNYGYATTQKGAFPWAPNNTNYPTHGSLANINLSSQTANSTNASRYHVYLAFYYRFTQPVTVGGVTHTWLDSQLRFTEHFNGIDQPVGTIEKYDAGDSFGYSRVVGGTSLTNFDTEAWFIEICNAYGIPTSTGHSLDGVEIGTEAFQTQEIDTVWSTFSFNSGSITPPVPITVAAVISAPIAVTRTITFSGAAAGGTQPYNFQWDFGDNTTANGTIVQHVYQTPGIKTINLIVTDSLGNTGSFSTTRGVLRNLDINMDGIVDIGDLSLVAFYYKTTGW